MTDIPASKTASKQPVLAVGPNAHPFEMFQCAEQRFRTARHLLTSLEGVDECDVRRISQAALLLLEDGCRVMEAFETHLGNFA